MDSRFYIPQADSKKIADYQKHSTDVCEVCLGNGDCIFLWMGPPKGGNPIENIGLRFPRLSSFTRTGRLGRAGGEGGERNTM